MLFFRAPASSLFQAAFAFGLLSAPMRAAAQVAAIKKPKLILVLVIDQFRADQIRRFESRFLPAEKGKRLGGFRYLMEKGATFPFAEYGLVQNMTCPGHATILSGAYAYQHGIAINDWVDRKTGKTVYCVEDAAAPLVGDNLKADRKGISPRNFHGSTVGDELKNSGYSSQVVTIALKDRAAVLLGGYRSDLALWFDSESGGWITSRFYRPDGKLPAWVDQLNASEAKARPPLLSWTLPDEAASGRSLPNNDLMTSSKGLDAFKKEFPHEAKSNSSYSVMMPYGTELTANAAVAALDSMKLGQGKDSDLLAVSFSNHDFVSHAYGPNSREVEKITVVEDRAIARLLNEVQARVGMQNTIVVLTADHGAPPNPDWLKSKRVDAGRVDEAKIQALAEAYLLKTYGKGKAGDWIRSMAEFNIYLNSSNLDAAQLDLGTVEQKLTQHIRGLLPDLLGIADVFSGVDVRSGSLPPGILGKLIRQTYQDGRSGDVVLIPKPHYIVPGSTTTHLSGYAYDRMVPLLLAGPQIKAGVYGQKVEVIDIAPTLAFFAGTTPPTGSEGRVLFEAIADPIRK